MSEPVGELAIDGGHEIGENLPEVDIRRVMEDIRARIKSDMDKHRDEPLRLSPLHAALSGVDGIRFGDLQNSEYLRQLNMHYGFEQSLSADGITSHRKGFLGRVLVAIKRRIARYIRANFLESYLRSEREFIENLVRHLNETGRYIDSRDEYVRAELEKLVQRIDDEKTGAFFDLQRQLGSTVHDFDQRVAQVDAMVRGLEGIVNNLGRLSDNNPPLAKSVESEGAGESPSKGYLLLENRYRGSEVEIERRLSIYPPMFKKAEAPVVEIGSGRGELQRLFKEASVKSYGVDMDTVMVNVANASGCKTFYGDGIAHLRALSDRSIGGIIAVQVVEHLTKSQIEELCDLAKRKVVAGGRIVFETINPQSVLALSSNYFRDMTHVWPVHPDTLGYMGTLAGLKLIETKMLSPVSANHLLKEIPVDSSHLPAVADAIGRLNQNLRQLNTLLYGFQDYCVVFEA